MYGNRVHLRSIVVTFVSCVFLEFSYAVDVFKLVSLWEKLLVHFLQKHSRIGKTFELKFLNQKHMHRNYFIL